jgi:formylglycine-generating enzyme required for sulfatase activity/serine/threonine protein kinase/Leucine-rich repeat (LRR) protein
VLLPEQKAFATGNSCAISQDGSPTVSDQSKQLESTDPRVQAALREYLEQIDRGELVNREDFLSRHADIANALRSFFATEEPFRKAAATRTPKESTGVSTRSFAAQGHETVPPTLRADRPTGATGSGLSGQFGRYRILRALGKGAMGAVYLAEDSQLERKVAIKTPHFEDDPTGELIARFYREARAAATLRQANICPVYDVGQIDGKHFISMAYIEGLPLADVIRTGKSQNERQIVIAVQKLARALQEAHDQGIVHRDLKPANIMVDKKGEPIIMDFGLARRARKEGEATLTQSGAILGSPAYMSPEQIEGDAAIVGPASDQYNLGVVLYEMLSGQLPFRGSMVNVLAQIITKGPTPPSELRVGLDPRIEAVCLRMMSKKASDRFASMKAVAEELAVIVKSPAASRPATEKSPTLKLPPAPTPSGDDARASQIRKPAKQKTLTESDVTSLEELVGKCARRHDYDQMIQIIERIPQNRRNEALQTLLAKAREKLDEISFLICEIDQADRLNDGQTALRKAEELLKIKPRHRRAREIQEKYAGYGGGTAARIGLVANFTKPWNEGGWISWSALAFGLAVLGGMYGVIVIYLGGKTALVIDVADPGVVVTARAKGNKFELVAGVKKSTVEVDPGEQELRISYAGLEARTKRFEIKNGKQRLVTVSIVDNKIAAWLDNEIAPLISGPLVPRTPEHAQKAPPLLVAPFDGTAAKKGQENWSALLTTPVNSTNSIGMKLRLIPPGEFLMGLPASQVEKSRALMRLPMLPEAEKTGILAAEQPQHRVRVTRAFYLGQFEVTRGQFAEFVRAKRYKSEAERNAQSVAGWRAVFNWHNEAGQDDTHPVVSVTWNDATAFCAWLSHQEGATYRLPTEAEWEYACRAGTEGLFYFGDDPEQITQFENVADATFTANARQERHVDLPSVKSSDGWLQTSPVGRFRPNPFGLYDMLGNAREWCGDWFAEDYYANSPVDDPPGPVGGMEREPKRWEEQIAHERLGLTGDYGLAGNVKGSLRVIRGGDFTFLMGPVDYRACTRAYITPGFWTNGLGFRVVREIDAARTPHAASGGVSQTESSPQKMPTPRGSSEGVAKTGADPDRRAAKAILALGGSITIHVNDEWHEIGSGQALPDEQFLLTRIELRDKPDVTDEALQPLGTVSHLLEADFHGCTNLSNAGFDHLRNQTKLRHLDVGATRVTDAGLAILERFPHLEYLGIEGNRFTDAGIAHIKRLTELQTLWMGNGPQITDAGLAHLRHLTKLQRVTLWGAPIMGPGLRHLQALNQLQDLFLGGTQVDDEGLAYLRSLPQLRQLSLGGTRVTDAGLSHLRELRHLISLSIDDTRTSNKGLANLESLTELRELRLNKTRISNSGLVHLRQLTELTELRLGDTLITDAGLHHLAVLTKLQKLGFGRCRVTDAGLDSLKGLTALQELFLVETNVTPTGIAKLQKSLPTCKFVVEYR